MFEISGLAIVLAVITIALMGGFSSKNRPPRSTRSLGENPMLNSISLELLSASEVARYRRDKTPMTIEVDLIGSTPEINRKALKHLKVGDDIDFGWKEMNRKDGRIWWFSFGNIDGKAVAFSFDRDNRELANRYFFVKKVTVTEIELDNPRLVVTLSFT